MYHHFGAVTNKRGDALPGFFVRVIDGSGNTVSLYSDSSATPIINVSGVADAALVDANGNADFWITEGTYTLQVYASDASTLYLTVPDLPFIYGPTGPTGPQGPAGDLAKCLSLSELASVASPTSGMTRYLALIGREGLFVFDSANHTSNVSADPGQWLYVAPSSDTTGASGAWIRRSRAKLTADRTFYVDDGGNNANDGSTALLPMGSIQQAINVVYQVLDCNGFKVTIQVADGTYTTPITIEGQPLGASDANSQWLQIIGNATTPANVLISVSGNKALYLSKGAYLWLEGVKITTSAGGYGIYVEQSSVLEYSDIEFGAVSQNMLTANAHSLIRALGPTTVSGDAVSFCHNTGRSRTEFTDQTITFVGTRTFSIYLWGLNDSSLALDGATLSGPRPNGENGVHDHSLLNAYSLVNASGWGFFGNGPLVNQDSSSIASAAYASRTFYVRSDASSDTNDGGENTVDRAFKTLGGCIEALAILPRDTAWWNSGSGCNIVVADGTYAEGINLRDLPFSSATITGNVTTPANVIISSTSDCIVASGLSTVWTINGCKLTSTGGSGIRAENGSRVLFQNIDFGTATQQHISVKSGAYVQATGNYTISGGAARHLFAQQGRVDLSSRTVTILNAPAFSSYAFQVLRSSSVLAYSMTFTGSATGARYDVEGNSLIDTGGGGATYLPGNATGITATGGQYV